MSLRASEIALVLAELAPTVVGGRLQKIVARSPRSLILEIKDRTQAKSKPGIWPLLLSAEPDVSRISLAAIAPKSPVTQHPFVQVLRRELDGWVLTRLAQPEGDRLVVLEFSRAAAAPPSFRLMAELLGRHANFF